MQRSAFSAVDCVNAEIGNFLSPCRNATICLRHTRKMQKCEWALSVFNGYIQTEARVYVCIIDGLVITIDVFLLGSMFSSYIIFRFDHPLFLLFGFSMQLTVNKIDDDGTRTADLSCVRRDQLSHNHWPICC